MAILLCLFAKTTSHIPTGMLALFPILFGQECWANSLLFPLPLSLHSPCACRENIYLITAMVQCLLANVSSSFFPLYSPSFSFPKLAFRLWIVDDEGVEQVIDRSALPILKETPIGYRFYKELVHKLFPSQAMQLVCLELYTLYLGVLPTAMVSKNDRALITMLHPQGDQ